MTECERVRIDHHFLMMMMIHSYFILIRWTDSRPRYPFVSTISLDFLGLDVIREGGKDKILDVGNEGVIRSGYFNFIYLLDDVDGVG